ncbi:HNH endonuclease signature motif containing protein [Ramlibacter sp.]|uniref:HNH endonuclease signature motif containing protein n=1 Tax=Ramlibacter sp. TaxID=1917967 RepID=UPI002606BBBB|nr:HNH endonuclease signature motif containing protein [Ramlibacter sp.]
MNLIARMVGEGYTRPGLYLRPELCRLLVSLEAEGFSVLPTGVSGSRLKGTICVKWRDEYLAYSVDISAKPDRLIGYQFNPGQPDSKNACPPKFDLVDFCQSHGYRPSAFALSPATGRGPKYLHVRDFKTALDLMRRSAAYVDPDYEHPETRDRESDLEQDLEDLRGDKRLDPVTLKRLIDARHGQGQYRKDLDDKFGSRCVVSGLQLRQVLRASHILAWSKCSSYEEKLDPNNGLLLAANLDALFDRYLITFAANGELVQSPRISVADRGLLGPLRRLSFTPNVAQRRYLEMHNRQFDALHGRTAAFS